MTPQPGKQPNAIYILPNISASKGNQTMKFAQLIEYNIKHHIQNVVERLFSDSFRKNKN